MKLVKYDPQTNVAVFSYHTEDEIALLPTTTMRGGGIGPVSEGSKAINDISANNVYSLTSDGVWVKYETGGGGHAITYDKMNLTLAQQKQVRENIAAPSYADIIQPKKIDDYLYEVEFTDIDWEYGKDFEKNKRITSLGACSSARSGNFFGRNYDWNYDETDYYIIRVNKSKTVKHWSIGMTGFPDITPDTYRALPFITLDGINDCGVFANINILPSNAMGTTTGTTPLVSKENELGAVMLPRFILDNFATAEEAVEYVQNYVSVYCKENEELHLMIGDATSTYLMEFIENAIVVTEMDERPYMTNFYLEGTEVDSDGHIDYDTVTDYGFGLERYDILADGIEGANSLEGMTELMNSINWTNAYSTEMDPIWKTEFVTPELELTIHSSLEDFAEVLTYERELFANRTRDGQTWQTCHTAVYDIQNKVMYLQVQENAEQRKIEYKVSSEAINISYDNTGSDLEAENVQDAIDEVAERVTNIEKHTVYGYHVNSNESDPSACVTYLADAVGMTPVHMDYANSRFDYGSWGNAFFMPKPCMLKTNGQVDYYLDPNDFSKKLDGTASDIANENYDGNAMVEWGQNGKKIWYKIVPDVNDITSYSVYISDSNFDGTYKAWSFYNKDNQLVEHFYTACYTGSLINGKLRSLSGKNLMNSQSGTAEIGYAKANGDYYNTEHWADTSLIFMLLYLMGKSLDVQTVYGNGHMSGGSSASDLIPSGQLNDKGLFYGYNDGTHKVKVFGMEDLWAEQWRRTQGLMLNNGTYYYKLTEGTADGSTANGYRTTDTNGMLSGGASPTSSNYVSKMKAVGDTFLPSEVAGASNKYYCDYFYQNQSGVRFALLGGSSAYGATCGLYVYLNDAVSYVYWGIGAALSFKPLGR